MIQRRLGLSFQIDTNCINARGKLEAMTLLEEWQSKDLIEVLFSEPALNESFAGHDERCVARASEYVFSLDSSLQQQDTSVELEIERILFPTGARTASERSDVRIVMHARKYHCILVTNDGSSKRQPGGILGHRHELKERVGVTVLRPEEAASLVREKTSSRDLAARRLAAVTGEALPTWIGCD